MEKSIVYPLTRLMSMRKRNRISFNVDPNTIFVKSFEVSSRYFPIRLSGPKKFLGVSRVYECLM